MFAVSSVSTILANSDSFDFLIQTSIILVQNLLYPESLNPLTWNLNLKWLNHRETSNLKVFGFGILDTNWMDMTLIASHQITSQTTNISSYES